MPLEQNELAEIKTAMESGDFSSNAEIKKLSEIGFRIHTEKSLSTLLDDQVEEKIKPRVREIHEGYENDIQTLTGLKKLPSEKGYDFAKRAIPEYAKSITKQETEKLTNEIAGLKKAVSEKGDPTGEMQKRIDAAEQKYANALAAKDKEIQDMQTRSLDSRKRMLLSEAHNPLKSKYRKDLPSYFQATEKQILDDVYQNSIIYTLEDGTEILALAKDGQPVKDDNFRVIPVAKLLEDQLKDAITTDPKKSGTGSTGEGDIDVDPKTITADTFQMPATVKTRQDLTTYMLSIGMTQGNENFDEVFAKFGKSLKLF